MLWLLAIPAAFVAALAALWLVGERGRLILPSTRNAIRGRAAASNGPARPGGWFTALHGYIYGRFLYQYIRFAKRHLFRWLGTHERGQWWADHYHGKVLPPELACAIITLDHDIPRTDLDQVIPYPTARDILLKGPPNVVLMECPCRLAQEEHCSPTEVCMVVGGGDFVLDHHPTRTRRITQEEALTVLQAEHDRGHVHTAYFKDACDNKFYAICNCCSCCCGGLQAMVQHGVPMVTASGFVAEVDEGACIACGTCEELCPFEAVHVNGRSEVVFEKCMGCGVCEGHCDTGAITLVRDKRKGIPLDVREIGMPEPVPAVR
jgi:Pyruvate/2-oxoacid:ferredoxin oxidoreductase delta subunit